MQKFFFVVVLLSFTSTVLFAQEEQGRTNNTSLPRIVKNGEQGYIKGQLIFPLDRKPTPQCHASTIVETPSGLVSAFFAGTEEGDPDVGIRVAHLVDGKWSWPVEVASGYVSDSLRYPCWNPVLFQPKGGPLMLFYKVGPSPQKWWGMVMTSSDDGRSWSVPRKLGDDPRVGHLLGPVKNKPVQLSDGTIINPTSMERPGTANGINWQVYFEISKDLGKTWQVVGPINDGEEFDAIQPSVLTYPDEKLQVVCRTAQDVLVQSWSTDQGKTWSKMTALPLPNPNSGTDAVTLKDGRQLLVYNHTTKKGKEPKGRNMLNVAISNNGTDWRPVLTLENEPIKDGYAYPAVIQSSDGLVQITYTYNRRSIKHVIVDPHKLY